MRIEELKNEYQNAGKGWLRAAFGSIVRRHYDEIKAMNTDERKRFVKTPDGHFKIPHLWPGQNPPATVY